MSARRVPILEQLEAERARASTSADVSEASTAATAGDDVASINSEASGSSSDTIISAGTNATGTTISASESSSHCDAEESMADLQGYEADDEPMDLRRNSHGFPRARHTSPCTVTIDRLNGPLSGVPLEWVSKPSHICMSLLPSKKQTLSHS